MGTTYLLPLLLLITFGLLGSPLLKVPTATVYFSSEHKPIPLKANSVSSATGYPDRHQFAAKLAKVQDEDTKRKVQKLFGKPDDVWRVPDRLPYPLSDEIWGYGSAGHLSLPTLGQVCFRKGRVLWVAGGYRVETVPSPNLISEHQLRAAMRFLHPGPEFPGSNDPLHLIRVANYLQPLGKDKALSILGEYARIHDPSRDETWLFLLLRTLFEVPDPPGYMPALFIGAMTPEPPKERKSIPRFPIVIVEDVPFSLLWGVSVSGEGAGVYEHVQYFQAHGRLRATPLRPPNDPFLSFRKLLTSSEWRCMAAGVGDARNLSGYEGHTLLQTLALVRTAYDPPEARQPFAYPKPADYERYHQTFLKVGARWDEKLQMYVRRDGAHDPVGSLGNTHNVYIFK